jgi:general stress protein 26
MVVWMGTNTLSRKVRDIRGNPKVAVYYADPEGPGYVTIRGRARLVDDPEETRKRWKDEWSVFYGEERSNYVLIEIRPEALEVVNYGAGVASEAASWASPTVEFREEGTSSDE